MSDFRKKINLNVNFVDTYATLLEHKSEDLFYRSDHHWTTLGAFYSYQKLANDMGLTPKDSDDYDIELVSNSFEGALSSESGYKTKTKDKIKVYIPKDENEPQTNIEIKSRDKILFTKRHLLVLCKSVPTNVTKILYRLKEISVAYFHNF